jgi:hypothetical protein
LRLISALAEGADRLAAREALRLGAELDVVLPFPREDYEKDFPDAVADFRELLSMARVFTLDGLRDGGAAQTESYEAAGRFVVGNCDLLLAVWDGARARGRGGTAEIVSYAIRVGVPVWWIDANGEAEAKMLRNALDFNFLERAPMNEAAGSALGEWMDRAISPPHSTVRAQSGCVGWIAGLIRRRVAVERGSLERFLKETPRRLPLMLWAGSKNVRLAPAASDGERYWTDRLVAADEESKACGERYLTSYALGAVLALIAALAFAVLAAQTASKLESALTIGVVFMALFGAAALGVANQVYRWRERWTCYRRLAELFRAQYVLSPLGRALPRRHVAPLDELPSHGEWVAWYFSAALRAKEFPSGDAGSAKTRALEIGRSLIEQERNYHRARLANMRAARGKARALTEIFFAFAVLAALGELLLVVGVVGPSFTPGGLFGAFLLAGAGALGGLFARSSLSRLARQSAFMLRVLDVARENLEAIAAASARPLGSLALGRAL